SAFTGGFVTRKGHIARASTLSCSDAEDCTLTSPPSPLPGDGVGQANVTVKTGSTSSAACVGCYYYYLPDSPVIDTAQVCAGVPAPVIAHVWDTSGNPVAGQQIQYTFTYSDSQSSVVKATTNAEGVASALPSKGANYVAGSYQVVTLNLTIKGSPSNH